MTSLVLFALLATQGTDWRTVTDEGDVAVAVQPVPGSTMERVRISGTSTANADVFAAAWWGEAKRTRKVASVTRRDVLDDTGDARVVYDVVAVPMGSERDYVLRATRTKDAKTGVVTLRYDGIEDARRPVSPDRLRMKVTATVVVTPTSTGGCRFEHVVFSDIGGSLPAFLITEGQRRATLQLAKEVRREAEGKSKP